MLGGGKEGGAEREGGEGKGRGEGRKERGLQESQEG